MSEPLRLRVGRQAEVEFIYASGETERLSIEIVPDVQADFEHGLVGAGTPLARALNQSRAGDQVDYTMGDLRAVRVLTVAPGTAADTSAGARRRQEVLDRARKEAERVNALNFASSFNSKWGDYDPAGIDAWDDGPDETDESPPPTPST